MCIHMHMANNHIFHLCSPHQVNNCKYIKCEPNTRDLE